MKHPLKDRVWQILLIEDNLGDVRLAQETLRDAGRFELHVAENGEQAIEILHRKGSYSAVPLPDLILLDLNLPKKDGREVLAEVKEDPELKHVPIIVLTTSHSEADIINAYNLHANCYITKPVDLREFSTVMASLEHFWLRTATLPTRLD
ncbi:MAG: response regulator [Anaerolineales bacterium]